MCAGHILMMTIPEVWMKYGRSIVQRKTCFCCSDIIEADLELYSKEAKMLFESIADIHTSPKREKMKIMYLKDATQVERLERQI